MPADQTLPLLEVDHGVANKYSKTTSQEESNITMLPPPELGSRFFGFHLDLSLQVEVLTVMPSTRKIMPMEPSSPAQLDFCPRTCKSQGEAAATVHAPKLLRPATGITMGVAP